MSAPLVRKIFSELIAHSVSRQASTLTGLGGGEQVLRIAYVGSPYTFNHLAGAEVRRRVGPARPSFIGQPVDQGGGGRAGVGRRSTWRC